MRRVILGIFGSFIFFIVTFYLVVFKFGVLERVVNHQLVNLITERYTARVTIGNIGGDYHSSLILNNLVVIYDDGEYIYDMAHVPSLIVRYKLSDLWHGQLKFRKIYIDSADISLHKSETGGWLVPAARVRAKDKARPLDFDIDEFGLNNLRFNLVKRDDTTTFDDIILIAHISGQENTYSVDIDALSYESSDKRLSLKSGGGKATLTGNNLIFRNLFIMTDSSNIKLHGQIFIDKSPRFIFDIDADNLNVHEFTSFLNVNLEGDLGVRGNLQMEKSGLSGNLNLSGMFMGKKFDSLTTEFNFADNKFSFDTLSGQILDGCRIEAIGNIDLKADPDRYYLAGRIEDFNLNNLVNDTYESDFNGLLTLKGESFQGSDMILNLDVDLKESWFDEYHVHSARGSTIITTDSIIFGDNFKLTYYDNLFTASGKLEYSGDIDISGRADFNDLSVFNNQIFIEEMGGRGTAEGKITGLTANPDLAGTFKSDSLWLYKIYASDAAAYMSVKHFLYDRTGWTALDLYGGSAYDIPFDTARAMFNIDSQFVQIKRFNFSNEIASAGGVGSLDYLSYPQTLTIDSILIDLFDLPMENRMPMHIYIDSAGYEFADVKLHRPIGFIAWNGRVNYDETINLNVDGETINIAPWIELLSDEYEIAGKMSGQADIRGSYESPLISFKGAIDSLSYQKLVLGDLFTEFRYAYENITIDSVTLKSRGGYYHARGDFPINLAFADVANRIPDKEQNIEISVSDMRFDFISLILEEVEYMAGDFKAELKLTGTPLRPQIDGTARIRDGRLKPYDLELPLENLNVDLDMNGRTVFIKNATATCGTEKKKIGTVSVGGEIIVNAIDEFDYDVNVAIKNFPARYELGDVSATLDAYLTIQGITPPVIMGDALMIEGSYRENFAEEGEGWVMLEALEGENSWDLNINVDIVSNLWIKNDDIDAELAGSINFIRESGVYRYLGSMEILRGRGFMAGRTFNIESGSTVSYEDVEYPNPSLDIRATTKIRGVSSQTIESEAVTETYDLCVHVTGTLDEPEIAACEDSRFGKEEILPLLFTDYYQNGSSGLSTDRWFQDRLISGISGLVSGELNKIGSRTLGVETFEIDPVYGDKFDPLGTRLTVGFYTHPNLYIYGRSAISGVAGQEVGFEYRLKRWMLVEGRADEHDLYQLILNFYWEYQ